MDAYFPLSESPGGFVVPPSLTQSRGFSRRGPSDARKVTQTPNSTRLLRSLAVPVIALLTATATPAMEKSSTPAQTGHNAIDIQKKHLVQPGETLSWIADMYGVSVALLAQRNSLTDPGSIGINQVLHIPEDRYIDKPSTAAKGALRASYHDAPGTGRLQQQDENRTQPLLPAPRTPDALQGQSATPGAVAVLMPGPTPISATANLPPTCYATSHQTTAFLSSSATRCPEWSVAKIGPLDPVAFLNKIAQLNSLIWYFDGNGLYVYNSEEIEKQIINLQYMDTDEFVSTLKDIGIWDNRFYWRSRPAEGIIYISGPPRYMELVTETARLLDEKSGERKKSHQTVRVFPLRYAWADDRTFNFRNQEVTMPGVASVLRQIVQGSGNLAGLKTTQTRSLQGMQASTPAGQTALSAPAADNSPPISSEGAFINADRRLNAVIVRDLESKMAMYQGLIDTLDKPLSQVEINVSIIDINTNNLSQLGVNWNLARSNGGTAGAFNGFGAASEITTGGAAEHGYQHDIRQASDTDQPDVRARERQDTGPTFGDDTGQHAGRAG